MTCHPLTHTRGLGQVAELAELAGLAACLAALLLSPAATAAAPSGRAFFVEPTSTTPVSPTDKIEVWMRLTLDAGSAAIDYVAGDVARYKSWADVPSVYDFWDVATQKTVTEAVADVTGVRLSPWFSCGTEFTNSCGPGAYTFNWNYGSDPSKPSLMPSLSLQPGQSIDYLFGTFNPNGTGAPAGTYHQAAAQLSFSVDLLSVTGRRSSQEVWFGWCGGTPDCTFTRQVSTVPEPSSYALLAAGVLFVAARSRRVASRV